MIFRWATIVCVVAAGVGAWHSLELRSVFAAVQPTTVALSIIAASVLVRLNRGMPTLDWKTLETAGRKRLTGMIVDLQREYLGILGLSTAIVIVLIGLAIVTPDGTCLWPDWTRRLLSAGLAGGLVSLLIRMGLVVWRDYDIVRLQKALIDAAADKEATAAQEAEAQRLINAMKAGSVAVQNPSPKKWEDGN